MSTQENELLLDSFLVKKGLLETVNPTIGPPRPTIDQSLNQSLDSFLKYKGYEIVGELPERPPVPTPEMKAYVEKEFRPGRAEAFTQLPGKPEDSYPTISTNILGATPGFWKQAKDFATAWATEQIDQTDIIGRDFFKGLTGGNIDPYDIVEKISGKPGFKEFAETVNRAKVRVAVGYEPREAMAFAGGAAESAGQMALLVPILKGAGIAAKVLPKIPMLRAVARGVVTGVLSGAIQKPEQEGLENRLKQIPPNVLFFTAFETLGVTAEQMLKIFRWNKEWRGYKPGAKIEPISKMIPGEAQEFTADEMKNLFRKMNANSSNTGGAWSVLTDREQNVVNTVAKSPGWKQAVREGFISEAVPETIPGLRVSPELIPRKPRMGDVFKNIEKLPKYEQFGYFKEYPEEVWPKGKVPPEAPGTAEPPPPVGGPGMAPKAAPAPPGAEKRPIAGAITAPERPPQVILDVSPKPGGGWTYTFRPGVVEPVLPKALQFLSPEEIKELPPHVQEIIKKSFPRGGIPRARKTYFDPLLRAIYELGGIKPNRDFPMEVLKDLNLPVGMIKNTGLPMDVLAQHLRHDYPELDKPLSKPSDQVLYDLLGKSRERKVRPPTAEENASRGEGLVEDWYAKSWVEGTLERENLDPSETKLIQKLKDEGRVSDENYGKYPRAKREGPSGETLGEFEGPGYQGADREAVKEDYRKWLESKGTAPEVIKKQLALFGGEFAPAEEAVVGRQLVSPTVDQKPYWLMNRSEFKDLFDRLQNSKSHESERDWINISGKEMAFSWAEDDSDYIYVQHLFRALENGEKIPKDILDQIPGIEKMPNPFKGEDINSLARTLGLHKGKGYQGTDKEEIKRAYEKWLRKEYKKNALIKNPGKTPEEPQPAIIKWLDNLYMNVLYKRSAIQDEADWFSATLDAERPRFRIAKKQESLFEGEFAPIEEPIVLPKEKQAEQPTLLEIPKRDKSIFDTRGLGKFKDINVWRKQVQPFIEQGYVVEYGHEGGTNGWARLADKREPGEGKLVSRAKPVEALRKEGSLLPLEPFAAAPKGTSALARHLADLKDAGLSEKELARHEGVIRDRAAWAKMSPDDYVVKNITGRTDYQKPTPDEGLGVVPKEPALDLRRKLTALMPKLGIPREKWGEVTRRVLKNYSPEEGELENYIRKTASYLTTEGEPRQKPGEPKEIAIEKIPEPGEKEPAYDRFEKKEQEARIRDVVTKEAHDDIDLDILENRIFTDPPEALETIGTRHGISRQAVDKRWQSLVSKLQKNPDLLEILNKKYELHSFPGIISKQNIENLRDLINKYFSSSKGVSKEVDMVNDERIGGILAEKFGATVEARKLDKYIKEQVSNPAVLQYFKDLLEGGNIQGAPLPADVKQNLLSMRERIDRLSDMIIAHGGVPEKTKAVFEDNIGKYLGKFYRIYEMLDRAKGKMIKRYWDPPQPVRDRFKNALKAQFPQTFGTYSDEEMDNFLEGMIRKTDLYARGAKRTKRIPPEHYIHRIKLTPEYREFAGEILDPRYLYLKTVSEQAVMGYNAKMLKLVKDTYPDLWTKDLDKARRLGWQKSQLPEDWHAYGEMAGLYIDPELGEYLRNEFFPSRSGMEHAIEKWIINPFKWTKTIGSIPTHARNFLGNPMFSMLMRNSIWNPANARFYIKAAKIIIGREKAFAKEWEELVRRGVTETQFWGAEIPRFYEELLRIDPADWPEKFLDAAIKRPINTLSNLYNSEDAIYRISAHLKNIEHFHMTPQGSVEEQNMGMTNYRKLPTVVEILRRYPVFGPFISFKANVIKILYNQAKQAAKDMGSKATRGRGIRRGFILASALALPAILQEASKKFFKIDSEDQKIIEKYMPEWRRHGIYFYWRNKEGTAKVFDFTYIFPAGDIQKAARAALAGDIGSFKDAINLFAHPVLDLYSVMVQDRDPMWGTKLPGGFKEQIAKALVQVWLPASAPIPSLKALVHGDIRAGSLTPYQIKTLIDSWYGEAPIGKEPKKFTEELKNFLTGVRTFDLNPEQIMRTYLRSKRFELTESMNEYRTWLKNNPGARDYEVNDKLKALQAKQKKISEALKQASEDIIKLKKGGFALESEK